MQTKVPPSYASKTHQTQIPPPSPFYPRSQRLVGLNPPTLTLKLICTRLHSNRALALLLVHRKRLIARKVLIDDARHTRLAVVACGLTAVVPEGVLVLDLEREDAVGLALHGRKVEAREDALVAAERRAWLVEGGLHDGVVLGQEVEFDQVTDLGHDVLGLEVEAVVGGGGARGDAVHAAGRADFVGGGCSAETEESGGCESDGCETDHFD
jgi:hypothetical protein